MISPKIWYRLTIKILDTQNLPEYLQDMFTSCLAEIGSTGSELSDSSLLFYFRTRDEAEKAVVISEKLYRIIKKKISINFRITTKISIINEEKWATAWHSYFAPIRISKRLTIIQPWGHYESRRGEQNITIVPQQAFGTGLHESTRLLLRILEKQSVSQKTVLDVGTGTGVAAIYAAKLGAASILAIDIEQAAIQSTHQHIHINNITNVINVLKKDIRTLKNGVFKFIMVNMEWNILKNILPYLPSRLESDGKLLISGLLFEQRGEVYHLLKTLKMNHGRPLTEGEWVAFTAYK